MTAHIKNGVIEPDEVIELPEGAKVVFSIVDEDEEEVPTLLERLGNCVGKAAGLPSDLALNHDHYLHGLPKK